MDEGEFFIISNSFAAPFVSDSGRHFVSATSPAAALEKFAAEYSHPAGLYAALCYEDANAEAKGAKALARWLCNHEQERARIADGAACHTYRGHGPGDFEVDGVRHKLDNPKQGSVV